MENTKEDDGLFICIAEGEKMTPLCRLNIAVETIINDCGQTELLSAINNIPTQPPSSDLFIYENYRLVRVDVEKIAYVKADRCYCEIHLVDGSVFVLSLPMSEASTYLPADRFTCIHRSFIVNRNMIMGIEGNHIFLPDGTELPISRQKRDALMRNLTIINTHNKKYLQQEVLA